MNFSELINEKPIPVTPLDVNGNTINIQQSISTEDKKELADLVLQESFEDGIYHPILVDAYFYTFVVMFYTDIDFSDEEKANVLDTYDKLRQDGLLDKIIAEIPEDEWKELYEYVTQIEEVNLKYKQTAAYLITSLVNSMPNAMQQASDILNSFDPEKFQEVVNFANAANAGRDFQTNQPIE